VEAVETIYQRLLSPIFCMMGLYIGLVSFMMPNVVVRMDSGELPLAASIPRPEYEGRVQLARTLRHPVRKAVDTLQRRRCQSY
jgi:hypothetical protein